VKGGRPSLAVLLACSTLALNGCAVLAITGIVASGVVIAGSPERARANVRAKRIDQLKDKYERGELTEQEYDRRWALILKDQPAPGDE
jgi:uncharacterized membrane protein